MPPSQVALGVWAYTATLEDAASCLPFHTLQRQVCSDRGFPARFIFMQAYNRLHINCQQLSRGRWQGSRGEG